MRRRDPWKAVAIGSAALGAVGVAVLVGKSATTHQSKGIVVSQRIALIGDSYAVGLGPELAKLFPTFRFEGHVGIGTSGWLACAACAAWLPTFRPTIVIVSLGVNDGSAPNGANYHAIVQALHGIGARVVWIEPPAAVNAPAVRAAIASLGVATVPATDTPLGPDGLHPASYGPWAQAVAQAVAAV